MMHFLNSKQRKAFFADLQAVYGYEGPTDFVICEKAAGKYYFMSRDVENVLSWKLRLHHGGLYVATRMRDGLLRLSMDGAQLLGSHCSSKISIDTSQRDEWMRGERIEYTGERKGYVIIWWKHDILGCGKISQDSIINYVPKERRIAEPHAA